MTFHDHVRREAESAFDALSRRGAAALREELDGLRAALEARMAALEGALAQPDHGELVELLASELSQAAAANADELVARARAETDEQAHAHLAEVQAETQRAVESALGMNAELTASLEEAKRQIDALHETAGADRSARSDLEAQLAREQAANTELSDALASAQTLASEAHDEASGRAADAEAIQNRFHVLDEECRRLRQACDEAEARATAEAARADELATQSNGIVAHANEMSAGRDRLRALEDRLARADADAHSLVDRVKLALRAFSGATSAQAIFDALVAQLAGEFATVALFLHRRNRLEGWRSRGLDAQTDIGNVMVPLSIDSPLARAVSQRAPVTVEAGADGVKLGAFGKPVSNAVAWPVVVSGNVVAVAYVEDPEERLDGAASCQIAEILVEQVGRCLVMGRRAGAPAAAVAADLSRDAGAPEPAAPKKQVAKPTETTAPAAGPRAIAKPADAAAPATGERRPAAKLTPVAAAPPAAEVNAPRTTPEPPHETKVPEPFPGPAREVDRFKIRDGVEVSVDGTTGQLVDLSTLGAQVVSSRSIRPQQLVRLVLAGVDGQLACKGRIVWARFEKARPSDQGLYRAGVRFTEADPAALKAFLDEYGEHVLELPARAG